MSKNALSVIGISLLVVALFITGCSKVSTNNAASTATSSGSEGKNAGSPPEGKLNGMNDLIPDIAKILNMQETELNTQLQSGKKLAEIASAQGIATDTLIQQIKTLLDAQIDKQLQEGKITSEQATTQKGQTTQRATDMVNGNMIGRGAGGGQGPGSEDGNPPPADSSAKTQVK